MKFSLILVKEVGAGRGILHFIVIPFSVSVTGDSEKDKESKEVIKTQYTMKTMKP